MQQICVKNGKVWERSDLHLKSAVGFDPEDVVKRVDLYQLKRQLNGC